MVFRLVGLVTLLTTAIWPQAMTVTTSDVNKVNWKVQSARRFFRIVWEEFFNDAGRLYMGPQVFAYTGAIKSGCGQLGPGNAFYCEADNKIYYDERFLAAQMKSVGATLHTDGDYAPIVILAHEWGHAADYWYRRQRKINSLGTFNSEQTADCLAGAVTRTAETAGFLDKGDLQEAERAIEMAGNVDLSKYLSVTPNAPKSIGQQIDETFRKMQSHGEPAERLKAFRKGYGGGTKACLASRG